MDVLELLKNKYYTEAVKLLPCWVFNTKTNQSFVIENITKEYNFKKATENIYIITSTYVSKSVYELHCGLGGCDGDYDDYEYAGEKQSKKTTTTNINNFSFDNLVSDVELTEKQKTALINFKQVVTK